jgi:ABC-type branched-subunit amino acid transport system substrate-binding protein
MKKIVFACILLSHSLLAQWGDQTYLLEYKKAVQLYADAQYDLAAVKFNVLCDKKYDNAIVPYAYFYNALNQKGKGSNYQSRVIFRQLFERFPDWEKIIESRLIYADLNFKDDLTVEGLKQFDLIEDRAFRLQKNDILNVYIPKITSITTLKDLHAKFPEEKTIAQRIVEVVQKNRYSSKSDLELSDNLTNRFKLNQKKAEVKTRPNTTSEENLEKKALNFGLLLPFSLSENSINLGQNRYIFEFYKGMQIASAELAIQKYAINILPFDVSKDKIDFQQAERNKGFKNLDAIIGPLYANSNTAAEVFSENNKIIQIHPFSTNKSITDNNRNALMAQPSSILQAFEGLQFLKKQGRPKTLSVFYATNKKDSLTAITFKTEAQKAGFSVNNFSSFDGKSIKNISEKGYIYFVGSESILARFISIYQTKSLNAPILASVPSSNIDVISKVITSATVSLICPDFVDTKKENVKAFQKVFFEKMNVMPSYYAYLGHDLAIHFTRMLKDGKDIYKLNLEAGAYTDEYLLTGFDFSKKTKENQIVPILKFNGTEFTLSED